MDIYLATFSKTLNCFLLWWFIITFIFEYSKFLLNHCFIFQDFFISIFSPCKLWNGEGNGTPLQPGKSHGWRSLVGCSPWGHYELDMTERVLFHFSLSCIGEGNGNPLQCSCLENPRDGGAWWASVYGVAQSQTQLKWLSSSSKFWKHLIKLKIWF